jgi:hypothetical protein
VLHPSPSIFKLPIAQPIQTLSHLRYDFVSTLPWGQLTHSIDFGKRKLTAWFYVITLIICLNGFQHCVKVVNATPLTHPDTRIDVKTNG